MKLARPIILLVLAALLPACSQPEAPPQSVRVSLERIANVDVNMGHYRSYAEYHDHVYAQIKSAVRQVSAASDLKALFLECRRRWKNAPETTQERLQWIEPHSEACNAILFRLAELNSEDATRVLVELYADQALGWDGEFALNAANAISRCGKRAIPHLRSTNFGSRIAYARDIVRSIEEGQLYGP